MRAFCRGYIANLMFFRAFIFVLSAFVVAGVAEAQMTRRTPAAPADVLAPVSGRDVPASVGSDKAEIVPVSHKRNARPALASAQSLDTSSAPSKALDGGEYVYEFVQPAFVVSRIVIRHDDSGRGTVTIRRKDNPEPMTDPVRLSPATVSRIKAAFAALSFLDSTESYQHIKDFSHLGTAKFTLSHGGRSRTAEFNWTENRHAKALADEYRKIGNEYIWRLDVVLARENQPLETPRLMTRLDSLLRRNEISDPAAILPFLNELENDERLPLIARNLATRMAKQIEKQAEKARK